MSDKTSIFRVRNNWDDTVKYTEDGLVPLAVMLINIDSLPNIKAELWDGHYPHTIVAMTTVFSNPETNGKLGWHVLEGDTRQNVSQLLYDNNWVGKWIYLSQEYDE